MSDTPETDALVNSINSDSDIIRHEYDFVEMTELARRLERERDRAWAICKKYSDIAERAINYMDPRYVYREIIRPEFDRLKEESK
jgi:hypothetical protein